MIGRRAFVGAGAAILAASAGYAAGTKGKPIQGFDERDAGKLSGTKWTPFSERKVRVGIAGEGLCSFGSAFEYQHHPNAEVVSCTDLDPAKCSLLQKRTGAKKTYPSCEELIAHAAEDKLEALYIATDAPSHARLAILALQHGLHVCSAVPAFFGKEQLDLVPRMIDAAKASGKLYMMNETTAFRASCYAMRRIFEAGGFGSPVYTEGEYFHYWGTTGIPSYNNWRKGLPPQYYPTHSNGYYTCVTHGSFTEVACHGIRSDLPDFKGGANAYGSPFASEIALFKTSDNSTARMAVVWDAPGYHGEVGRIHGTLGSYTTGFHGLDSGKKIVAKVNLLKPLLPPGVDAGAHGGSHGYLTDDFLRGILVPGHKVCVDLKTALDTTLAGVYAHISAEKGGETLKIPQI
ncbi:MAG: Gfo/Idh/MocA family oxidoreductase [Kiritimatiellia bacterium]|nr:Gfo/Idh/MocA family oxidoreductase [Kiritimatiellia bacterium]